MGVLGKPYSACPQKAILLFCRGWEVPGDPALCPLHPALLRGTTAAPAPPFLPIEASAPHPHFPAEALEPDSEIRGLFSKGPELSADCGSGSEGHWGGGGHNEPFLYTAVLGATDPTGT